MFLIGNFASLFHFLFLDGHCKLHSGLITHIALRKNSREPAMSHLARTLALSY
jgi:prepilin-type processing-associated H-X9-DG protein